MTHPIEAMLAKWPMLYPDISGAVEQDGNGPGEAARVRSRVIVPILHPRPLYSL